MNAIETTNAYALVKYKMFLPVAITESNIKSNLAEMSKQSYYINRTFPLMMSTFALLRHPGKVIHRLLFDYKVCYHSNTQILTCTTVGYF